MRTKISVSILDADFLNLKREIESVKEYIEWLHLDVMDGHFVPNLTFGWKLVSEIKSYFDIFLDVHIMVEPADAFIEPFCESGADMLTFHVEATHHSHRLIERIKNNGIKAGISLNPGTSIENLKDILPYVDLVLVMSVNPGFGGQKFIEKSIDKVRWLSEYKKKNKANFLIEVDGGINNQNAGLLADAGADVIVCGSYIFKSRNRKEALNKLRGVIDGKGR